LITALRTAVEDEDSVLDTDATSHDDLFDAFRMSFAVLLMTYSMFYTTLIVRWLSHSQALFIRFGGEVKVMLKTYHCSKYS
jgi:hypothetical protein